MKVSEQVQLRVPFAEMQSDGVRALKLKRAVTRVGARTAFTGLRRRAWTFVFRGDPLRHA